MSGRGRDGVGRRSEGVGHTSRMSTSDLRIQIQGFVDQLFYNHTLPGPTSTPSFTVLNSRRVDTEGVH